METPDKIYVNFPFGKEHPWRGPMVTRQGLNRHDTTYIRADALMEWAKEMKRICKGAEPIEKAYQTVIDRIESL